MKLMLKFIINTPEVKNFTQGDFTTILMDIDKDILNTTEGANWIANGLLSGQRIEKVLNEYNGYAGGLATNQLGQITGKYIDQGIVDGLKISKQEQWKAYQENQAILDEQFKNRAMNNAKGHGIEIKNSHADDLSVYEGDPYGDR